VVDLFGFSHPITPTGRKARAWPGAKEERDKQRKREQRAKQAAKLGRPLRKRAPNGEGMSPEERRKQNIELKRQRRLEQAQSMGRDLKVKLHDGQVKAWSRAQREAEQRGLALHDSHVREWKKDVNRFHKWKYQNVARYNIYHRLKRWMHKHIGNSLPSRKWSKYLGYTTEDLKKHLQRQFQKGMNWENKGQWHIDHIVPVSSFKIESIDSPEFRACFGLSNLRPVWAKDNQTKGAKRTHLI
jgi:hypothetical protein